MKKYPILIFDLIVEENEYNILKHLKEICKKQENGKDLYKRYITYHIEQVRNTMRNSNNEDLRNLANNFISIYLKDNNEIGAVVFDAVSTGERKEVMYEKIEDRYVPYIEI